MHPQTLRIYERKGLIEPSRTEGRSRRYSDRDIALLQRIQELTNEGVSLVGVRKILELEAELDDARLRIDELRAEIERAHDEFRAAVEEVRRSYRRDLVPMRAQTVVAIAQVVARRAFDRSDLHDCRREGSGPRIIPAQFRPLC